MNGFQIADWKQRCAVARSAAMRYVAVCSVVARSVVAETSLGLSARKNYCSSEPRGENSAVRSPDGVVTA